jgi:N-acetylglucosaminyldiphosphoundecaprenol N-acetyl-beta-D-mannosaminyltransferase
VDRISLFGRRVLCGSADELRTRVLELGPSESAYFCNVHMLMLALEEASLARAMNDASMIFPDGVPIAWLQRRLGHRNAGVLRGYEAMDALCADASADRQPVGLLGSTPDVLNALTRQLKSRFEGLKIDFVHAPPKFSIGDIALDRGLVDEINAHQLRCLFVGLGCPKQEIWIDTYRNALNCPLLGVGAAFDWLAGTTRRPPRWMETAGLAWLFRLFQDPGRMWHRYLVYNSKFIFESSRLLISSRRQ